MVVLENAEPWEDDELTRSLQHIDPHTAEYIERLTDEQALYNKILRTLLYIEELKTDAKLELPQENINRIVMRRVEHIYFKVRNLDPCLAFSNLVTAITSGRHSRGECLEINPEEVQL